MTEDELVILIERLIKQSREIEWVAFKLNYHSAEELGQMLSGLSNGACLEGFNKTTRKTKKPYRIP